MKHLVEQPPMTPENALKTAELLIRGSAKRYMYESLPSDLFDRFKAIIAEDLRESSKMWANDIYVVWQRKDDVPDDMIHLCVIRNDGRAIHDWRHLQEIKNQILGPDAEAVELYPAESRLVDKHNVYHLWAYTDKERRFPFGCQVRDVVGPVEGDRLQRELDPSVREKFLSTLLLASAVRHPDLSKMERP